MSLKVLPLTEATMAAWDAYVDSAQAATFFHKSGWKTVQETAFGHSTHFLYAEEKGQVVGVLPLVHIKSALFGSALSSTPFCVYGGVVGDRPDIEEALRQAACKLARELKVGSLELRNREASSTGWPVKDLYFTFRKEIDPDDDVNLKAIPNRQRAMIRKGIAEGLESEWDTGTERVYRVYSESVRNLGTPIFSSNYLRVLKEVFADECSMLMITHEGQDVAGVMSFYFRNEVIPYYGGSTSAARNIKGVNHFMYWELMRYSREQGYTLFDFGRSKKGTGAYSFKKNFGFPPESLPYEYFLVGDQAVPEVNPLNPKYQLMIKVWTRLPLPVANALGPFLAKSLG